MEKPAIETMLPALTLIFKKYPEIVTVLLFGSYLTPFFTERSDLDFGVVFNGPVDLFVELSIETDLSLLLKTDKIDLVNLNQAPLILKYNAVAKGKIIYEADYIKTSDFLEAVYRDYCDFEPDYRQMCADFDESLKEDYHG
ncbi:MAG TPA: nucleotidyltransferase domain-containing protein [Bacillota bacterium]|nr:nucleotidyltransferase domain-containing protein [Bacillota bacterium]